MNRLLPLLLLLLATLPALAQTPGTLNLSGPSTGGQTVTTATINAGVNAQLGSKADTANPVFTGTVTAGAGAFSGTLTLGAGGAGGQAITGFGTGNMVVKLGGSSSVMAMQNSVGANIFTAGGSSNQLNLIQQMMLTKSAWSGANSTGNVPIWSNATWTGTNTGSTPSVLGTFLNITHNVANSTVGNPTFAAYFSLTANGAAVTGPQHTIEADFSLNAATNNPTGASYSAANFKSTGATTDGGTGTTPDTANSIIYGINPVVGLANSGKNWQQVVGAEIDTIMPAGTSSMDRIGMQIVDDSHVAGSRSNIMLSLNNGYSQTEVGRAPYATGIMFGANAAQFPLSTTGTMIDTTRAQPGVTMAAANTGINLLPVNFANWGYIQKGASFDGSGTLQIGAGLVAATASGLSVDAAGSLGTGTPTVSAGGVLYVVGDIVEDAWAGIYQVATIANAGIGSVGTVSVLRQPFIPNHSTPSNPVATVLWRFGQTSPPVPTGGAFASGLALSLSWNTANTTLSLNPSGGPIKFGAGQTSANASVATALGSVGPVGSHTTVQEWLTYTNSAGVIRYLPAF